MALQVQITFDCHDADAQATFWAGVLGYQVEPPPDGFASWPEFLEANGIPVPEPGAISAIVDPNGTGPRLLFLRVPEPKTAKNRMHLDVQVGHRGQDPGERRRMIDAKVAELLALGATHVTDFDTHEGVWTVLTDPEGNEFCVV